MVDWEKGEKAERLKWENKVYITYDEWKNGLIKLQNGKVIYKKGGE